MMGKLIVILLLLTFFSCNSSRKEAPKLRVIDGFSQNYKEEILKARTSAERKLSNFYKKDFKLNSQVSVEIKNKTPNDGFQIGGISTHFPGSGTKIVINYVDDKLFKKLEHEFAHAILRSNGKKSGHYKELDHLFYNWEFSRKYGSG